MKVEGKEVINMEMFKSDMDKGARRIVREVTVKPTPAVKGMVMPPVHSNLSQLDIKGAFVTAQNEDTSDDGVDSRQTIDFEEWCICLGLCGQIKYEEVTEMTLRDRIEGIIANYLKGEGPGWGDEHDVITKAVVAPRLFARMHCSDQMNYKTMANILSGAWGCFDEFNRIGVEVLSVIAGQYGALLDGMKAVADEIIFEEEKINLRKTIGAWITMNPGYAGRAELPENLKALVCLYAPAAPCAPCTAQHMRR